ncbi:MAG: hypothetical protein FPO08_05810 [Geobacter sp.]|nr:MAG: hypothetical protein FPO08_05810 [Geobacter sp.]
MRASEKLYELWRKYEITPDMIGKFVEDEVIRQKDFPVEKKVTKRDGKTKTIKVKNDYNYPNNNITNRMRRVVVAYNKMLDRTHIDCDAACIDGEDRIALIEKLKRYNKSQTKEIRIKLLNKNVYRVFNNRSWEQGGRFYGAWWIGCSSILRKYITLNGEPTCELDYSGIHIHLLYAQKGINYAAMRPDAYTLDDGLPDRDLNKLILLTAINAENENDACSSVFNQLRLESGMLQHYNITSYDPIRLKLNLLKEKHSPIADKIASGEGIKLQYFDSCVIEKLIIFATEHNIPVLTIHDSVVCAVRHADIIKDRMWHHFTVIIQDKLGFSITYMNSNPFTRHIVRMLADQDTRYRPQPLTEEDTDVEGITVGKDTLDRWLQPDDIVKIKTDRRANGCKRNCNHCRRVDSFLHGRRSYLGPVVVRLVGGANEEELEIRD